MGNRGRIVPAINVPMLQAESESVDASFREDEAPVCEKHQLRASDIRRHLDTLVIGQEEAKERLSLLISMHLAWDSRENPLHAPPNAIIVGPTGSGKTFTMQVASKFAGVPFITIDSTSLVPIGARNGNSVEDIVRELGHSSPGAEKCILFLDEFDKVAMRDNDTNREWKADIQRGLLKFIEGQALIDGGGTGMKVLVLAGGAFVGIDKPENIRKRRAEVMQLLRTAPKGTIVSDDLVNFGFMPELIARLPAVIQYENLPESALLEILRHPESSPLLVWQKHFAQLGKRLCFTEKFLNAVARRATTLGMGARGLQQIVFPALARSAYAFESSPDMIINVDERILEY